MTLRQNNTTELNFRNAIELVAQAIESAPTGAEAARILREHVETLSAAQTRAVDTEYLRGEEYGRVEGQSIGFDRGRDWIAVNRERRQMFLVVVSSITLAVLALLQYVGPAR